MMFDWFSKRPETQPETQPYRSYVERLHERWAAEDVPAVAARRDAERQVMGILKELANTVLAARADKSDETRDGQLKIAEAQDAAVSALEQFMTRGEADSLVDHTYMNAYHSSAPLPKEVAP